MFKDCKTGGYNLEWSKASIERLTRLVLLIAIANQLLGFKRTSYQVKRTGKLYRPRKKNSTILDKK
jgi:hypothetical protein